jgi:plasmid maintenance system killer protein
VPLEDVLAAEDATLALHRINDQWRACFIWAKEGPEYVEIVATH